MIDYMYLVYMWNIYILIWNYIDHRADKLFELVLGFLCIYNTQQFIYGRKLYMFKTHVLFDQFHCSLGLAAVENIIFKSILSS